MPILAGQVVTAGQLNRLQPKTYDVAGTGNIIGAGTTDVDVPGATITITTETAGATVVVETSFDFDFSGGTTTLGAGRLVVDGTGESRYALFQQGPGSSADRVTAGQNYRVVLGAAGSHTLKLVATVPTNMNLIGAYTSLVATVHEVV
ncbi:hypothetical protein [Streptomyces sp. TRM75563]|uniref:hypothetical protein n=1 Tax=Streptomyces sp. TRM75563 TaxID=2817418 RepID=UPI001F61CD34|nr:hypothetical protein [Streptomyces sp. TRM75563]MCI4045140.1 hypothetical protein [Streptomyces sp. TRM75563]